MQALITPSRLRAFAKMPQAIVVHYFHSETNGLAHAS